MTMAALTFEKADHAYFLDGVRIPNVTKVTDALSSYAGIPLEVLQRKAEIGDAVHFATELDDANDLDDSSLPEEIRGYVYAWRAFKSNTAFLSLVAERRVWSDRYKFAGTLDRIGVFGRLKGVKPTARCLIDIKTTYDLLPAVAPQLAAYQVAWNERAPKDEQVHRRFACQLKTDGSYRLEEFSDPTDWSVFLSVMTVEAFKKRHKLGVIA